MEIINWEEMTLVKEPVRNKVIHYLINSLKIWLIP
jgi:hypothetical protein